MTVYTVTGLGYGDEGKGTTVDYLCRQEFAAANLVVRHNGGGQAGHNVVLLDGTHHEFSQFGSGTLAGASTFLSRFVLINPLDMMLEANHLDEVIQEPIGDVWSYMHVDPNAKIVTPYHIAWNRLREIARHGQRHGSCGAGIGATMRQHLTNPRVTITVGDLRGSVTALKSKLEDLRVWLQRDIDWHDPVHGSDRDVLWSRYLSDNIADQYQQWANKVDVVEDPVGWLGLQIDRNSNVIFEGAQGVLLDEWRGWHPHTTWSTTTDENALTLLNECYQGPVTRLGITRAYATRHGAGPFPTEDDFVVFDEPHNTTGDWQGGFRQGHLDLVALRYAVAANGGVDGLVVTHLDRTDHWKVAEYWDMMWGSCNALYLNPDKTNLERQESLTNQVKWANAPSAYSYYNTDQVLDKLGEIAPVHIQSWGPTHADKKDSW